MGCGFVVCPRFIVCVFLVVPGSRNKRVTQCDLFRFVVLARTLPIDRQPKCIKLWIDFFIKFYYDILIKNYLVYF